MIPKFEESTQHYRQYRGRSCLLVIVDRVVELRHPVSPTVLGQLDAGGDEGEGEHGARHFEGGGALARAPDPLGPRARYQHHSPRWPSPRRFI